MTVCRLCENRTRGIKPRSFSIFLLFGWYLVRKPDEVDSTWAPDFNFGHESKITSCLLPHVLVSVGAPMNFPAISRWGDALLQALPTISNEDSGGVSTAEVTWCWLMNFRSFIETCWRETGCQKWMEKAVFFDVYIGDEYWIYIYIHIWYQRASLTCHIRWWNHWTVKLNLSDFLIQKYALQWKYNLYLVHIYIYRYVYNILMTYDMCVHIYTCIYAYSFRSDAGIQQIGVAVLPLCQASRIVPKEGLNEGITLATKAIDVACHSLP